MDSVLDTLPVSSSYRYLIQDPYHEYGVQFIEHIYRKYGYRAICLYTDRRERLFHEASMPQLRSDCVAAAYDAGPGRIHHIIERLREEGDVLAVIPFNETSILSATEIAARLGLSWAQPDVMRRFRDKYALKHYLRGTQSALRINASQTVRTSFEVLSLRHKDPYRRFVLKPNDGYGNRHIGFFDDASPDAEIDGYLDRMKDTTIVMEEYIDGTEYFVNGQVDAHGNVTTIAVFEYLRRPANGRHNIDWETQCVCHGTPLFHDLASYAENIMRASGLRRSPFHLELKVDARGPCLIEAAARLPGHDNATLSGELHGARLDLIDLACHYYFSAADYGVAPLDWATYDSQVVRYVHGVARRRERLYDLRGIAEVEALPEFYKWVKKPFVGMRIERTVDTLSMPWNLILKAPTKSQAVAAASEVRRLIQLNCDTGRAMRAALSVKFKAPRALARLRRSLRMTLPPLNGEVQSRSSALPPRT